MIESNGSNKDVPAYKEPTPVELLVNPNAPHIYNQWHDAYIEMLADPSSSQTDKSFCTEHGIHKNTLFNWKKRYRGPLYRDVNRRRVEFTAELRTKAYKSLYNKLENDTSALKLAFQLMGDLIERSESKVEYMSREDKIKRIDELLKGIGAKKKMWKGPGTLKTGIEKVLRVANEAGNPDSEAGGEQSGASGDTTETRG